MKQILRIRNSLRDLPGALDDVEEFCRGRGLAFAGLRSIFAMRQALAARSGRIVLLNARPQVQNVFDIVKAADIAAVFASVEELDRYLDARQRKVTKG